MHSSNLLKLLFKLDKEECKRFDKFIQSPYFNSNKTLHQLWTLIRKYHPALDSNKLEKEKVFRKLFPQQAYKEDKMWKLMSQLKGLVEQFLVVERNDKKQVTYQMQLRAIFLERDLYDWFKQKTVFLENELADHTNFEVINKLYLHQIHDTAYYNNDSNTRTPNHPNLINANTHLQYYFHFHQLRYACEWVSRAYRMKEQLPLFVKAITYRAQYEQDALYSLYYKTFILLANPSEDLQPFTDLVHQLKSQIEQLPKKHQIALLMYLLNYGIKKLQSSGDIYTPLLFELYQLGLQDHRLIYKEKLSEFTFLNIITIGCKLEAFNWIEAFIKEFQIYLPPATVATSIAWAKGVIAFKQGQFQEAIHLFESFSFDQEIKELTRRSIQLRACLAYFMMGDESYYELVRNKSLSFEKYLMRKKNLKLSKRTVYLNLNKAIRKLAQLIYKKQTVLKFEQLYKDILLENEIVEKEWLLQQIQKGKIGQMKKTLHSPIEVKRQLNLHQL